MPFSSAAAAQTVGGGNNLVIISNSVLRSGTAVAGGAPIVVGWGSSNNTLTLLANTSWDNNNQGISVGANLNLSSFATLDLAAGNTFNVNGAIISNLGQVVIGYNSGGAGTVVGISNAVNVLQRGVLSNVSFIGVGRHRWLRLQ